MYYSYSYLFLFYDAKLYIFFHSRKHFCKNLLKTLTFYDFRNIVAILHLINIYSINALLCQQLCIHTPRHHICTQPLRPTIFHFTRVSTYLPKLTERKFRIKIVHTIAI